MKRLEKLKNSILKSITDAIENEIEKATDYTVDNFEQKIEIEHNKETVGYCKVIAEIETLSVGFAGDNDYPPYGSEYKIILESVECLEIYGLSNNLLTNIVEKINNILQKFEGKQIN
jgi:hypothetical protein